jgi:DNA polymerase-3 subunit gamma/tau
MVGQEHIINEMKKRASLIDFPQVMLFSGPTDSGKTSLCYIISSLINCVNPIEDKDISGKVFMSPCGKCHSCLSVQTQRFGRDIYVYNASTLAKAEVEHLDAGINFAPLYDRNKIVVIEEFQQFSTQKTFGSLYTMLEEPRKRVYIFLICMDISKIPAALQDRCAHYQFDAVSVPAIVTHLHRVLDKAGKVSLVPDYFIRDSLSRIAEYGNGSVRRAVQALERCIYAEVYSKNEIEKFLGLAKCA